MPTAIVTPIYMAYANKTGEFITENEETQGLAGQPSPTVAVDGSIGPFQNYLPSILEGNNFSIDLVFKKVVPPIPTAIPPITTVKYVNATDVTTDVDFSQYNLTCVKLNAYTFRISGTIGNIVKGSTYTFVFPDGTERILPPFNKEKYFSLVSYTMPSPTFSKVAYPFTVTTTVTNPLTGLETTELVTTTHNIYQWGYWSFSKASDILKAIVASRTV